jgi:hypothetical protein
MSGTAIFVSVACGETLPAGGTDGDGADAAAEAADAAPSEAGTYADLEAAIDGPKDAAADGEPCAPDLAYGDPEPLANLDSLGAVASVRPHHGGAPFAFVSRDLGSGGFFDLVEIELPMPSAMNPVSMRSGPNDERYPAPLAGNMKVYYDEPIDAGVFRVFSATRGQAGQKLENPQLEDIPLPAATSVMHPWSVAGQDILYVAARTSDMAVDIWRIAKSGATWNVDPQVSGAFEKTHPVVSDDERVMYFARNETGKRKIQYVTRSSPSAVWSGPLEVQGMINAPGYDDEPSWLSPDQCTLIFISNRDGGARAYKIVRQHR